MCDFAYYSAHSKQWHSLLLFLLRLIFLLLFLFFVFICPCSLSRSFCLDFYIMLFGGVSHDFSLISVINCFWSSSFQALYSSYISFIYVYIYIFSLLVSIYLHMHIHIYRIVWCASKILYESKRFVSVTLNS